LLPLLARSHRGGSDGVLANGTKGLDQSDEEVKDGTFGALDIDGMTRDHMRLRAVSSAMVVG